MNLKLIVDVFDSGSAVEEPCKTSACKVTSLDWCSETKLKGHEITLKGMKENSNQLPSLLSCNPLQSGLNRQLLTAKFVCGDTSWKIQSNVHFNKNQKPMLKCAFPTNL